MSRILSKEEWLRRRRRRKLTLLIIIASTALLIILLILLFVIKAVSGGLGTSNRKETLEQALSNGAAVKIDYLTPNRYSRPGTRLKKINGIVIHYTANPGTSAENNRSYFEGLKDKRTTYASSHYIIGLEGEILQLIPLTEESYASNDRNDDTIAIECCHQDSTGEFNEKTYNALISLTAALCAEFNLDKEDIIRH
jgi:N-acetyl-anhydromuramyl-L-alanine amidase AmpD